MKVTWQEIKKFATDRALKLQWIELESAYAIKCFDGPFMVETELFKNVEDSTELDDFLNNFKDSGNTRISIDQKVTPEQKIPQVAVSKIDGSSANIVTHDWTDPCTWYQKSLRVNDEILNLVNGVYESSNINWIDLTNGRVFDENSISGYDVHIKGDNNTLTEHVDYQCDYENGKVTIINGNTYATVSASYNYATSSEFVIEPKSGKQLLIEHSELQFTTDIDYNTDVIFQIRALHPDQATYPNLKVPVNTLVYKNVKDIINGANLGKGYIPAFGNTRGINNNVLVFPFDYTSLRILKNSLGVELVISLKDDIPLGGEFATLTFYTISQDEE